MKELNFTSECKQIRSVSHQSTHKATSLSGECKMCHGLSGRLLKYLGMAWSLQCAAVALTVASLDKCPGISWEWQTVASEETMSSEWNSGYLCLACTRACVRPSVHSSLPSKLAYMEACSHLEGKFAEGSCPPTFEIPCVELHMTCHFLGLPINRLEYQGNIWDSSINCSWY